MCHIKKIPFCSLCPSEELDMDSIAVRLTMNTKTSLILALITFATFDEVCENGDGDLFYIVRPYVNYVVSDPKSSMLGSYVDHLKVDDHEYTLQISTPYKNGQEKIFLFYKKGYRNRDKIELNETRMLNLSREYGFKDLDFKREFGYQGRKNPDPVNPDRSCYHYECNATVNTENCNLNTSSCTLTSARTLQPDKFIGEKDGIRSRFYGQCQMSMTSVTGNIFNIWLGSAFSNGLPIITVLVNSVKLDWGEAASKFPEGNLCKLALA